MKLRLLSLAVILAAASQIAVAQNTIKIFDAKPIAVSRKNTIQLFAAKRITLTCPAAEPVRAFLTGPGGGAFAVDSSVTIDREWVHGGATLSTAMFSDMISLAGLPMESGYSGHDPVDVSGHLAPGEGVYEFELWDFGGTYGNTDLYLATNCTSGRVGSKPRR